MPKNGIIKTLRLPMTPEHYAMAKAKAALKKVPLGQFIANLILKDLGSLEPDQLD